MADEAEKMLVMVTELKGHYDVAADLRGSLEKFVEFLLDSADDYVNIR